MKKEERFKLDMKPEEAARLLLRQEQMQEKEPEKKEPADNKKPDQE